MKRMIYQFLWIQGEYSSRRVGYIPMVDEGSVSWTPKKQEADMFWTTQAEEEEMAADVIVWLHCLFRKIFPPPYINEY